MEAPKLYKDPKTRVVDVNLFSTTAKELAQKISASVRDREKKNAYSQVRKFYDELLSYRDLVRANPDQFLNVVPLVRMLAAKAAYAKARNHVTQEFADLVGGLVNQIGEESERKDLETLVTFFEAFMGYYRVCAPAS